MHALRQRGHDKIILLKNVSTISLDISNENSRDRIVVNYMNPMHLFGRWTPDYHYFEYDSTQEAIDAYEAILKLPYIVLNFFISENADNKDIVNKNSITSISVNEEDLKIIFNLNYPVTSYREKDSKPVEISKVIFWNYFDDSPFEGDLLEINESLDEIVI